ncbi:hypothetical protein pdam_00013485 [Pocillopora damicornis]|uniref:Uncharacterized protein n=2 Tax=Pocillopora damicornis TaxID=46731 RepID=A0A3M6TJK7_POCDA|nr:hypothetical protein pdam_00013485 [Pocillopora damicornis]
MAAIDKTPTVIPPYRHTTYSANLSNMRAKKAKHDEAEGGGKAGMPFSSSFQDQKNYQEIQRKEADSKIEDNSDYKDSWSSDEGEGISLEELKLTKGYQLFKEALQAHAN